VHLRLSQQKYDKSFVKSKEIFRRVACAEIPIFGKNEIIRIILWRTP
jgi:hypothetical protein